MINHDKAMTLLRWKEVAAKSKMATFGFSGVAAIMFYFYFDMPELKLSLRILSSLIILTNAWRFFLSRKMLRELSLKNISELRWSIWVNAFLWSLTIAICAFNIPESSLHLAILLTIVTGFVTSSIVTLGLDASIFFPFVFLNVFPLIAASLYKYSFEHNNLAKYLLLFYVILLIYLYRQYQEYHREILSRFRNQLALESSLEEVRKGQEELVNKTAQLIYASRLNALVEMAGGLSHEINNSLMTILASVQMAQREIAKDGNPSVNEKLEKTREAIGKITAVVEGLKYFSRQMEPQAKEEVTVKSILQNAENYMRELLKAQKVELRISEMPYLLVEAQPFQLINIILSIVQNANDSMTGLPQDQKWVRIDVDQDPNWVYIRMENGGRKIPLSDRPKLFQPFFSTKDVNEGTGLSLSISKGIAKEHGGDLYFDDSGHFTTFVLKLPRK